MQSDDFWDRIYASVRNFKENLPHDAEIKRRGFSILYNPPKTGGLLVVGFNPSRSSGEYLSRHPESEIRPPESHLYADERGGRLAVSLKSIIDKAYDGESANILWSKVLEGNKTNLVFFGSRNVTEWSERSFWGDSGFALKSFVERKCAVWVRNIIEELEPSAILIEGIGTLDRMQDSGLGHVRVTDTVTRPSKRNQRLYIFADLTLESGVSIPVLGILHPTGARPPYNKEEAIWMGKAIGEIVEM